MDSLKRPPIRNRLVLVGLIVTTAIIGATGLIIEMQRIASIDAFQTATVNLGNGMAQQTTQSLGAVDHVLTEIQAALSATGDPTNAEIQATMRSDSMFGVLSDDRKLLPSVTRLLLVNADGKIVNASGARPAAAIDVSSEDYVGHFRTDDDRTAFVGEPIQNTTSGKWSAFMARRVDDPGGRFAGLVVAEISLSALQDFYQLAMPKRRSVYLLRQDGVILVHYPQKDGEIGRKVPDLSPWYAIVAKGGGPYHAAPYFDGAPVIASVHKLRNLPFVVEAAVTEADALTQWYQQRIWVVVGGISSVICVFILLRLFGSQYRRLETSERSVDAAHRQLEATLANLSQGVCFYNEEQKLVVCNRRYCDLYELPYKAILPGISLAEIAELRIAAGSFPAQTVDEFVESIDAILREGEPVDSIAELTNGRTFAGHLQPLPGRGWVETQEDITARREAEAKIAFLARHDVLTGLANRALFEEQLQHALALAERGMAFAVLCLDLDRFKAVNDNYGHPIGDRLLCAVADRLREAVRDSDTIARLGGDEFAILLLDVSELTEITIVARRIVQSISENFDLDGNVVNVGTSIGISLVPGDSSHPAQLMKNADLALYRSKQEGRGTLRFFEPAMDDVASARRALEIDLREGLPLGQLELYYQPLVLSRDRSLSGFEALLRWRHPKRGLVAPGDFISVAEEAGLIPEIGAWVLEQACLAAATWPDHLRVAVNLSTKQFRGLTLVGIVADALRKCAIAPSRLELEITESVPLQKDEATLTTLHQLRGLGVRIALDDFGTGYSSLSYLRGFPFDTIKIDRAFVSDLQTSDKSVAIIRGIIGLATNLRMAVVAEGVETETQYAFLANAGCAEIQGYLISKPVPAGEVQALIERMSGRIPLLAAALA